ncbi:MAG: hypothetical protein JRE18_07340 [Deltaproteobacteria bacterium]|jgi:hypothetical protein|nr:hypothetical protein [Deltaproteobacteria bacterium]
MPPIAAQCSLADQRILPPCQHQLDLLPPHARLARGPVSASGLAVADVLAWSCGGEGMSERHGGVVEGGWDRKRWQLGLLAVALL